MSGPSARRAGGMEMGTAEKGDLSLAVGGGVGRERLRAGVGVVGGAVISHAIDMVFGAAVRADARGSVRVIGVLLGAWTDLVLAVRAVSGGGVLATVLRRRWRTGWYLYRRTVVVSGTCG